MRGGLSKQNMAPSPNSAVNKWGLGPIRHCGIQEIGRPSGRQARTALQQDPGAPALQDRFHPS